VLLAVLCVGMPALAVAQTPVAAQRVTFKDAIQRAMQNNPSVTGAAAGILRADALLTEARSATRLQVSGSVTTTTLNTGVTYAGTTITPQNSLTAALGVQMPLYAPVLWARHAESLDAKQVAELNAADVRQQIAQATADAFLTIIAARRTVEANELARETAKAHVDLATQLEQGGSSSKLNRLRAQQELSTDERLVESARLALYRATEALGVLLVADGPMDAADEPALDVPPGADAASSSLRQYRTDLKLFSAEAQAAEHVLADSSKDRLPFLSASFAPQAGYPAQFFGPVFSWRFLLQASVPLFDSGQRSGQEVERRAAVDLAHANVARVTTQASSEVRAGREAVASAERGLASARAAADQAHQVVDIVNISFRAGASTNIEVIDAERTARDADTAVATAEDTLRRAKLELLIALGRFPNF
jgi:outer membrane protein TolC